MQKLFLNISGKKTRTLKLAKLLNIDTCIWTNAGPDRDDTASKINLQHPYKIPGYKLRKKLDNSNLIVIKAYAFHYNAQDIIFYPPSFP